MFPRHRVTRGLAMLSNTILITSLMATSSWSQFSLSSFLVVLYSYFQSWAHVIVSESPRHNGSCNIVKNDPHYSTSLTAPHHGHISISLLFSSFIVVLYSYFQSWARVICFRVTASQGVFIMFSNTFLITSISSWSHFFLSSSFLEFYTQVS